jgi:hypothetical protein
LTTSHPSRVRLPRHVARLITRIVAWLVAEYSASRRLIVDYSMSRRLVVDYSTSRRLVVDYSVSRKLVVKNSASHRLVIDYFASVAHPGASARRAAYHTARRAACR